MTGDGVERRAGAEEQADCGIAVSGATDAAARRDHPHRRRALGRQHRDRRGPAHLRRITTYTIYRVALTMDIMVLVVLSTVFLGFQPLTAVMIVIMSLLDDIPIMTIAYDHTRSARSRSAGRCRGSSPSRRSSASSPSCSPSACC